MKCNDFSITLILLVTATLAGCAAEPDTMASDASDTGKADEQLVCVRERQTGSHIPRKVCRTQAQVDAEREAAREATSRAQQQSSIQQSGTAGN